MPEAEYLRKLAKRILANVSVDQGVLSNISCDDDAATYHKAMGQTPAKLLQDERLNSIFVSQPKPECGQVLLFAPDILAYVVGEADALPERVEDGVMARAGTTDLLYYPREVLRKGATSGYAAYGNAGTAPALFLGFTNAEKGSGGFAEL
jgi:hypothetical protein